MRFLLAVALVPVLLCVFVVGALTLGNLIAQPLDFVTRGLIYRNFLSGLFTDSRVELFAGYGAFGLLMLGGGVLVLMLASGIHSAIW